MIEGLRVTAGKVASLGQAFAGQQGTPATLAGTLNGARAVNAGNDAALTAQIQSLTSELATALQGLSAGLQQDATKLAATAQCYVTTESAVTQRLEQCLAQLPGSGP
jgi:hypothetical protein